MRGPLYSGLPTVEHFRKYDVLSAILQLHFYAKTDICLIGDIDIQCSTWKQVEELQKGYISLHATIHPDYEFVKNIIHHDRTDSSDFMIRSQESRSYKQIILKEDMKRRCIGSISIGNCDYLRYCGELEIAESRLKK